MGDELATQHEIGDSVYRENRRFNQETGRTEPYWYEPYRVLKVSPKRVEAIGFMEHNAIRLDAAKLRRLGRFFHRGQGSYFYAEMPEEFRRKTIGYLMDHEPRKILGLPDKFDADELKRAYRRRATETHPDRGGDASEFVAVEAAYRQLANGHSLGDIFRFAEEHKDG